MEAEYFNIVVLGAMNPRLHHPAWYSLVKLISETEAEEAAKGMLVVSTPYSVFHFGGIEINCQEARWEIKANDLSLLPRLRKITAAVFDELLLHTPVSRYGFNFHFVRGVPKDCPSSFVRAISSLPLAIEVEGTESIEINLRRKTSTDLELLVIRALSDSSLSILRNYEYEVPPADGFFKLGNHIESRHDADMKRAVDSTDGLVASILSLGSRN